MHKPESSHYSGIIYNRYNNDYLISSSENGFINIWDLYNRSIFNFIKISKFFNFII